ncbi:MAG: FHA domain-containing protein [Anaerolineae bacterium]|nr:FHA domain-containing protein [Anaerolineae bacterium]
MDEKPAEDRAYIDGTNSKGKDETGIPDKSKARITTQPVCIAPPENIDINSILAKVPPGAFGLFIVNSGDLLLVERVERITLGRQAEDAGTAISIDLTPYGGEQSGVSRRHAVILVSQDMYLLQDLGSTNGTRLNAVNMLPNSSQVLRSGDMIQLGLIRIQVVFHGPRTRTEPLPK